MQLPFKLHIQGIDRRTHTIIVPSKNPEVLYPHIIFSSAYGIDCNHCFQNYTIIALVELVKEELCLSSLDGFELLSAENTTPLELKDRQGRPKTLKECKITRGSTLILLEAGDPVKVKNPQVCYVHHTR